MALDAISVICGVIVFLIGSTLDDDRRANAVIIICIMIAGLLFGAGTGEEVVTWH